MRKIVIAAAIVLACNSSGLAEPFTAITSNFVTLGDEASVMYEVRNTSQSAAKMISAECVFRDEGGNPLDIDSALIRLIEPGQTAVRKFSGSNVAMADKVDCYITSFYRVN